MSAIVVLSRDKDILLQRSALCRLRLRRQTRALRDSLQWQRVAVAATVAPTVRRIALGVALSFFGLARIARIVVLAGRIVLFVKLARLVTGLLPNSHRSHP